MKTIIAIPCMDTIPYEFSQSLLYMSKGADVSVLYHPNSLIYDSRNLISLTAIENNVDNVLWIDSDIVFQPDAYHKLLAHITNPPHAHMISGLYVKRHFPTLPVIYDVLDPPTTDQNGHVIKNIHEYSSYPRNALFPVRGCGFGFVITSTKLLKDVWDHFGPAFLPFPWAGEDLSFCHRVNQLGYSIYCDSSVSCGHVGKYVFTENDLKRGDIS